MGQPAWAEIEAALERLKRMLEPRVGQNATRTIVQNLWRLRETPGVSPTTVLQAVHQNLDAFGKQLPSAAPFSLGVSKAIREAAIRKLPEIDRRMRSERPPRGIDDFDVQALATHADALVPAYGRDDPEFAAAVAYLNAFTFAHHLIFGEVHNRNDREPVFALAEAARAQALDGGDPARTFVPLSLVRGQGVIYSVGRPPSPDLTVRWRPEAWMFVPFGSGRSLRLDDHADLEAFLVRTAPPIEPSTLAALIHVLLAPFPFEARVSVEPSDLVQRWIPFEARLEDQPPEPKKMPSAVLGVERPKVRDEAEVLIVSVERPRVRLVYRPPALHFERY